MGEDLNEWPLGLKARTRPFQGRNDLGSIPTGAVSYSWLGIRPQRAIPQVAYLLSLEYYQWVDFSLHNPSLKRSFLSKLYKGVRKVSTGV